MFFCEFLLKLSLVGLILLALELLKNPVNKNIIVTSENIFLFNLSIIFVIRTIIIF